MFFCLIMLFIFTAMRNIYDLYNIYDFLSKYLVIATKLLLQENTVIFTCTMNHFF